MGGGAHPGIVPGGRGAAGGSSQDEGREPRGRRLGSRPVEEKVKRALFSSTPIGQQPAVWKISFSCCKCTSKKCVLLVEGMYFVYPFI